MKIIEPSVEFIWSTCDPLKIIELAGRTCYKSEGKITCDSAEKFVRMLIRKGHESVLEHASASFRIVTDRGVSHELVRHRLCSFSQESTRYVDYMENMEFIQPPGLCKDELDIWKKSCEQSEQAYIDLRMSGCSPQISRSVLPACLKTEIVVTCNFREWRHLLELRTSKAAHPQIKEICDTILDWFSCNYPVIVEDIKCL